MHSPYLAVNPISPTLRDSIYELQSHIGIVRRMPDRYSVAAGMVVVSVRVPFPVGFWDIFLVFWVVFLRGVLVGVAGVTAICQKAD